MKLSNILLVLSAAVILLSPSCTNSNNSSFEGNYSVSDEVYERAESMLGQNTSKLIDGSAVAPNWINANTFWYTSIADGKREYIKVNTEDLSREPLFDQDKLAESLSKALPKKVKPGDILLSSFEYDVDGNMLLGVRGDLYRVDIENYSISKQNKKESIRNSFVSPDGNKAAFIREFNLWVEDIESGKQTQLTFDGIEDYGYSTNNAGWTKREGPVLLWSSDSKKIATFRHDGRYVGEMYMVSTAVGHPELYAWKYPLPGDSLAFRIERIVIDVESNKITKLKMDADQHRSTTTDHIAGRGGTFLDVEWNKAGDLLSFVSTSRDHSNEIFRVADPNSGVVRDVFKEKEETFFESGHRATNWRFLPESNEVVWYSQRDNWGHLYLYDLESGKVKNQITKGDWKVLRLLKLDEKDRKIIFTACGRESGDPYFEYLYSINMDGSGLTLHTPDSANHTISLSPGGNSFVDTYSTPVTPPVSVLRIFDKDESLELSRVDHSRLLASGWVPPIPFTVKARDGNTDIYGLMHKPSDFDPAKKYAIINYIYPGPQSGSVGSRSFSASRSDRQAIAELGFIVVAMDAMGTPMRSKSFHEAYYGNMGDNGLPDQISGMKQLAKRYDWIDIDRVGIYGHSGGGYASTDAILRYPDFFDVAVSGAGNHDNRTYEDDWGEKWHGLLESNPDGSDNYDSQANQLLAKNLKGKLLLAHGTLDSNVPPNNTLMVVNALIAENKDFDLIMFPNRGHGFGNEPYMMRRRWDYFVMHLLGAEPPEGYEIGK